MKVPHVAHLSELDDAYIVGGFRAMCAIGKAFQSNLTRLVDSTDEEYGPDWVAILEHLSEQCVDQMQSGSATDPVIYLDWARVTIKNYARLFPDERHAQLRFALQKIAEEVLG